MNPPALRLQWTRALEPRDAADYDAFVAQASTGHYAQGRRWAKVACAGRLFVPAFVLARDETFRVVGTALVLRACWRRLPLPYAVVERGPVVSDPSLFRPFVAALTRAARRRGIARLALMPYWEKPAAQMLEQALGALGWVDVQTAAGPHVRTLRLATAGKTDAQLFAGGHYVHLRQKIRAAQQAGVQSRRGSAADLPAFAALYNTLMRRQGRPPKSDAWLRAVATLDFSPQGDIGLFLAERDGRPLTAALVVRHGRLCTYAWGASDDTPMKIAKMVPPLVAAIHWARDVGCDFDLGGIPMDGDSDPKRLSIAQFKRDFAQAPVQLLRQHARWLW
ncbi:MAG TPA: GNAT family N-acetyltransferase [Polyangia bacterium]